MKHVKLIMLLMICFFLFNSSFTQSAHLKISGVKGESVSSEHKEWIDVLSFGMGVNRGEETTSRLATGRPAAGKMNFQDLVITKKLDKASPVLMMKTVTGEMLPEVQLEIAGADGRSYYTMIMKEVIITSISTTSDCEPKCETIEEISLSYSKISWEYTDQKGSKVVSGYDVKMNKKL